MSSTIPFDVGLGLENTHVLITGGAGLVGGHVVRAFLAAGSKVTAVDLAPNTLFEDNDHHPNLHFLNADIRDPARMEAAFRRAWSKFGPVHTCVALASLDLSVLNQTDSLADMNPREWNNVIDTNVNGTFVTCRQWLRSLRSAIADNPDATPELRNVSLIIMGSESGRFGVRTMAAYAAGKAAVQVGLLQSLALDAPRIFPRARVNAIAPGPVDTPRYREEMATYGREWHWKEAEATCVFGPLICHHEIHG